MLARPVVALIIAGALVDLLLLAPPSTSDAAASTTPQAVAAQTPTPTPSASPSPTTAPRQFTVLGAGDVLLHSPFWSQAANVARSKGESGYDFEPLFDSVRPDVSGADLAICHMETPLGTPGGPFDSYPIFNVPPQIATAIKDAGFDRCSTASNHTIDKGYQGVVRTLDALDAAGLGHSGSARTAAEATALTLVQVNGVSVGHLSYTFSFNGLRLPADKPWLANSIDGDRILADAHRLKQAGAAVVIVSLHWGVEYSHTASADQVALAHRLLESPDVDLILGGHAHVVQPFEQIAGEWVVYGMGNEVAWQNQRQDTRDGVMPRFTFTEVSPGTFRVTKAEAIPTFMLLQGGSGMLVDLPRALADRGLPASLRGQYQASLARTRQSLLARDAPGLVVVGG
jgi:poly-gamma-glutamate capsule biosynthesis protein CapA/YwtB (metallophosphatase superfamily)